MIFWVECHTEDTRTEAEKASAEAFMLANMEREGDRPDLQETDPYHAVAEDDAVESACRWATWHARSLAACVDEELENRITALVESERIRAVDVLRVGA